MLTGLELCQSKKNPKNKNLSYNRAESMSVYDRIKKT